MLILIRHSEQSTRSQWWFNTEEINWKNWKKWVFLMIADETTDISSAKQIQSCAKYVSKDENKNGVIHEHFLTFEEIHGRVWKQQLTFRTGTLKYRWELKKGVVWKIYFINRRKGQVKFQLACIFFASFTDCRSYEFFYLKFYCRIIKGFLTGSLNKKIYYVRYK